jgi:hypothetical protein
VHAPLAALGVTACAALSAMLAGDADALLPGVALARLTRASAAASALSNLPAREARGFAASCERWVARAALASAAMHAAALRPLRA